MNPHEGDLEWYCSRGITKFSRSPFGTILEMQESKYINPKEGEVKGGSAYRANRDSYNTAFTSVPSDRNDEDLSDCVVDFQTWGYMHVKPEPHQQRPDVELGDLHRFGKVSSTLYKMERVKPAYVSTLMAYYGDRGARWARERSEGRLLAVYPLTKTGAKWVTAMIVKSDVQFNLLREDERLATECYQQEKSFNEKRMIKLRKIEQEARAMHREALTLYTDLAA